MDVVNAWEDFLDEHITILKGIESAAFNRNLSGNTLVHVPFLEDTLRNVTQKSNQIVSGKEEELKRIFHKIDDIISLKVFSSEEYDYQMYRAEKERKATLDQVYELDQYLVREYKKSEAKETYAKELFQQLLECSKKNGVISPLNFDSKAYHSSDIYRMKKKEFEKQEETKKKENSPWYKVVGDVLLGIGEGVWNAIVDIFKGLWDLGVSLLTDPIGFFKGIGNVIAHPLNTGCHQRGF
jgi:predicted ribonuclease toxin of YeeF-YezG toxin-antitoxin module